MFVNYCFQLKLLMIDRNISAMISPIRLHVHLLSGCWFHGIRYKMRWLQNFSYTSYYLFFIKHAVNPYAHHVLCHNCDWSVFSSISLVICFIYWLQDFSFKIDYRALSLSFRAHSVEFGSFNVEFSSY